MARQLVYVSIAESSDPFPCLSELSVVESLDPPRCEALKMIRGVDPAASDESAEIYAPSVPVASARVPRRINPSGMLRRDCQTGHAIWNVIQATLAPSLSVTTALSTTTWVDSRWRPALAR